MASISPQEALDGVDRTAEGHSPEIRLNNPANKSGKSDARQQKQSQTTSPWWKSAQNVAGKAFGFVKWILLVIVFFIVIALIASWNMNRYKTYSKQELQQVHSLVLYAAKSAEEAERVGRTDPMQGLLNANYAVCYVNAAKHMVNEDTLESLVGTSMAELEQYLTQLQHTLLQTVLQQCEVGKLKKQSREAQKQNYQRQVVQNQRSQNEKLQNTIKAAKQRQTTSPDSKSM